MQTVMSVALRYVNERVHRGDFSPTTAVTVRTTLLRFAFVIGPQLPVVRLHRRHIEQWLSSRRVAVATLRNQMSIVATFTRWLVVNGYLRNDPMLGFRPPRQPRYLPRAISAAAVAAVLSACVDVRDELMVLLMAQEGCRCKEVAGLQVGDVDLDRNLMLVKGKGGHERVLPISTETGVVLRLYLKATGAGSGTVVRSQVHEHRGLTARYVSYRVGMLMREAKVTGTAHALRHTAATDMLRNGAHLRDVQAALGHTSLHTTQRYLPWLVGDLREAMGGRAYRGIT